MNPNTGAIAMFETDEDAIRAGFTKKLTDLEAIELRELRREQRLEWIKDHPPVGVRAEVPATCPPPPQRRRFKTRHIKSR